MKIIDAVKHWLGYGIDAVDLADTQPIAVVMPQAELMRSKPRVEAVRVFFIGETQVEVHKPDCRETDHRAAVCGATAFQTTREALMRGPIVTYEHECARSA